MSCNFMSCNLVRHFQRSPPLHTNNDRSRREVEVVTGNPFASQELACVMCNCMGTHRGQKVKGERGQANQCCDGTYIAVSSKR